jgi:type I restriction enzyme M protein
LLLNREAVRKEAEKVMTGASGHRRVPSSFYENYQIPVPPSPTNNCLVAEMEKLEQIIAKAQAIIAAASAKKQAIMQTYL